MIKEKNGVYILHTKDTTYAMRVMECGQVEHLYYGRRIRLSEGAEALFEKHAFAPGDTCLYTNEDKGLTLQDTCLEVSGQGKGDMREPFIEVIHADGSRTSDFVFESAEISSGKAPLMSLPSSYDDLGEVENLKIIMKDARNKLTLELHYYVFEDCNVITRTAVLHNEGQVSVRLERLMSAQLDLNESMYRMTTFNGTWAREMRRNDMPLIQGRHISKSTTGNSSAMANPFFMISGYNTEEDRGDVFGFNLIYSANHMEIAEVNDYGKLRILWGISDAGFEYLIEPGEVFEAPEAVMTFSYCGFNGMSQNMHSFVRKHIVRGMWRDRLRPILLNSWEASYFKINESKLMKLARAGKSVGIELFVMDDGWFGERNDDTSSLGDWEENKKKLPGGINGIAKKIHSIGMDFGLWVEPEMVNVNSKLYREHPDWSVEIPGGKHSEGRNQRILDLTRTEVQDYIIESMSRVFSSGDVNYVKWDMNRNFSDVFSQSLPPERQGEVSHRYIMGLYRCMRILTERFPKILFEGCASGGNRFDLGILSYFPQIWGSDDTDAICRAEIQCGYSYGYPLQTVGAHVSGTPNHQTLRITPLDTRFTVAAFGSLGYECNLSDMSKDELSQIKEEIRLYKEWREVFQKGSFFRGRSFTGASGAEIPQTSYGTVLFDSPVNLMEWTVVSEDKTRAAGMLLQRQAVPNWQYHSYKARGLDEGKKYHFYNIRRKLNIMDFGDLVNTVSPVHIRQGSAAHEMIAKVVKMDGELTDITAFGSALMYGGVKLSPAFGGTGLDDKVRPFADYASRMYFMEEV